LTREFTYSEKGTTCTTPLPERAWKKIGEDLCEHKGKQFLVVIDYYSRFPEIAFMSSTTSHAVINKLKDIFARWGVPDEIVGDNGPQFSLEQFRSLAKSTTSSILPLTLTIHKQMEKQKAESVSPRRY